MPLRWNLWQSQVADATHTPPPLLALHGFSGQGADFRWLAHAHRADFTLFAPDFTGHGTSDSPLNRAAYRIGPTLRAVHATFAALRASDPRRPILLGYSMGGRIALRYLARYGTDAIRALVLIGTSAGLPDANERRTRRRSDAALANFIEQEGIAAFAAHWNRVPLIRTQQRSPFFAELQQARLRNNPQGLANSLRGIGTGSLAALGTKYLSKINIPCLVISGAEDAKFTAIGQELAATLPQAQHTIIAGAGHAAHLEAPSAFSEALHQWMSEHSGSASDNRHST